MEKASSAGSVVDKRIAIVCGHFTPETGYQEVGLARAFTRLGARVRVVTSTELSRNARAIVARDYRPGVSRPDGYDVVRLSPRFTVGPNLLGCRVLPSIAEFAPDCVILVGPGKLFGLDVFSARSAAWTRIAIIQDNSEAGGSEARAWRRRSKALVHRLVKRPAYRRVVRNADRIILNVPETREIVGPWLGSRGSRLLAEKGLDLRLGFDPEDFFFDPGAREAWRARHRCEDEELLLGTCTRVTPGKGLCAVISAVSRLRANGLPVRYVLAGLVDNAESEMLRDHVATQPDPGACVLLPVLGHDEMRQLFSACDVGCWSQAAITIQQAMGTGLPVVLRNKPTVSHLVTTGRNGWYVQGRESLESGLKTAIESLIDLPFQERLARRRAVADFNRARFSYDEIACEIVAGF
jgi:glycosyltransferase involved in cell wall biosynthesis